MKTIGLALLALCLCGPVAARADQTTVSVQQALKDQGFYYGNVDGQKNGDTTAALRRYQIRNGLQITGEIDAETLRSLGMGAARAPVHPALQPARKAEPSADDDSAQSAEIPPAPNNEVPRAGTQVYPGGASRLAAPIAGVFARTPYEMAPMDLQRHVIVGAQSLLARYGFYRSGIDGEFGPTTAAAVRAFQNRARLFPDGRLNIETLGALGLLPGQRGPRVSLPRVYRGQPVYRGEWIPN